MRNLRQSKTMKLYLRDYPAVYFTVDMAPEETVTRGGLFRHEFGGIGFLRGCCSKMSSDNRQVLQEATWSLIAAYMYRLSWQGFESSVGAFDKYLKSGSCLYFDLVHHDKEVRDWVSTGIRDYLDYYGCQTDRSFCFCGVPYMLAADGTISDIQSFVDVCDRACEHETVDLLIIDGLDDITTACESAFIDLARKHNLHILFINQITQNDK